MSKQNPKTLTSMPSATASAAAVSATAEQEKLQAAEQEGQQTVGTEGTEQVADADKPVGQEVGQHDETVAEQTPAAPAQVTEGVKDSAVQEKPVIDEKPLITGQIATAAKAEVVEQQGAGVVMTTAATAVVDPLAEKLDKILDGVSAASRNDITRIRMYCQTMAPKKSVSITTGAQEQATLYRSIQNIINRQETHFVPLFTALLAIFAAESVNGALSDRYRNRFMEHVNLSKADRTALQQLTHVLAMVANPGTRKLALRQINLERALSSGLTAEGQRRVLQYLEA